MSENTVLTYRDCFVRLLEYMRDARGIRPERVTTADLGAETLRSFLDWLETDLGVSVSTRNNRLAAIRSFFRYVSAAEPALLGQCAEVLSIAKKRGTSSVPTYLTTDAVRHLLSLQWQPFGALPTYGPRTACALPTYYRFADETLPLCRPCTARVLPSGVVDIRQCRSNRAGTIRLPEQVPEQDDDRTGREGHGREARPAR